MTFRQHLGPRFSAATAFVSIGPKQSGSAVAQVELVKPLPQGVKTDWQVYGLEGDLDWAYLRKGLVAGLETTLADPVADVTVRVLNTISDRVDSSAQAFKTLGQWLVEALVHDMDQRKLITMA